MFSSGNSAGNQGMNYSKQPSSRATHSHSEDT